VELLPKSICSKNFITSCQIRRAFGDRSRRACGNSHLYFLKIRESFEGIKVKKNAVSLGKICTRCARNVGLFPCPGNSPFERIINIHATSGARTLAKKNNLAAVAGMYNFQPIFHALCPKCLCFCPGSFSLFHHSQVLKGKLQLALVSCTLNHSAMI
jgi:hypothetical protein